MKHAYTFVANWKMYLSHTEEKIFIQENKDKLSSLFAPTSANLVICPSFVSIPSIKTLLNNTSIAVGAQNCSSKHKGAYTGEVSARSLAELGVSHCIVGHSERRTYYHETDSNIAEKITRLIEHKITPIICIGETKQEREQGITTTVLKKQLTPAIKAIQESTPSSVIFFAYEPLWSIGTGITPTQEELNGIIVWLNTMLQNILSETSYTLLYGGSVTDSIAKNFYTISSLGGFLIGGASVDFQALKKIVGSWYTQL